MRITKAVAALLAVCLVLAFVAGCEDDDDYNHNPPEGKGSLIIDNTTYDDIYVWIDGIQVLRAPYRSERVYDIDPGEHRVVLDQRDGDRYHAEDVDILQSKVTVWKVSLGPRDYIVTKWID